MSARCLIRGSINIDEFFHVKDIVRPGETISSDNLEKRAGGKGANQAVAVARAGAPADLVAAIGPDGLWVKDQLQASGVDVTGIEVVEDSTGRAIIQLTDVGENSIILYKGANYSLVHENKACANSQTTHVLLQNEIPYSETLAQLDAATDASRSTPLSTIFNPSPMPSKEQLIAFPWKKLTWLIVNEGEASDLNNVLKPLSDIALPAVPDDAPYVSMSAYPILLRLSKCIPCTNIVCTLGGAGVLAYVPSFHGPPIFLPAAKLQGTTRDTTGAGDCFTGYMTAGLMKLGGPLTTESLTQILARCVQAAGMCVEKRGAMESIPLGKDVDTRLASSL